MHKHLTKPLRVSLLQLADIACSRERDPVTRLRKVDDTETDKERNRGDDLKVKQRLQSHAAYFFQVAAASNSHNQSCEY